MIPNAVVSATVDGASPMKAWREHLRLTQAEMAAHMGITQAAHAQMEAANRPRKATLTRMAGAMGVSVEQLDF
ncbi:MAG: helix-turn-helix transcriptional regulator [Stenotrophomonas sp.]